MRHQGKEGMANDHTGHGDRTEAPGNVNTERRGCGKGGQRNIKKIFFKLITTPPNNQI